MIEYLNNPALLILACEVLVFLFIANLVLLYLVTRKNNKAVKALNALVTEIKEKSEDNKKKMAELLLQPGLTDPEAIKQGMQELVSGQTELYKDMIKAIRTQNLEDVSKLGDSVSSLVGRAINLGRESGEGMVDKEAQARLETENENLHKTNDQLENKLQRTAEEMASLMSEYKSMMANVNGEKMEEDPEDEEQEIMDITEGDDDEDIIDIASSEEDSELDQVSTDVDEEAPVAEEIAGTDTSEEVGNDDIDDILGDMAEEMAEEFAEQASSDDDSEQAA